MNGVLVRSPMLRRVRGSMPARPEALVAFSAAALGAGLGRALVTSYLPVLLERIRDAPGLIGTVMLVNTLAGFLVPLVVGVWSDRLRGTGHGRTMPFILGGSALTAGGLLAIALGHATSYLALALFAAVTYAGLNAITTAHRALIPETFDEDARAAATSGEELAMLGGTLLGVATGGVLFELAPWAPFALGAVVVPLVALPTVRRMRGRERPRPALPVPVTPGVRYYARAARTPGARLLLLAQGLWVMGYVGLPPFFVLYAERELDLGPGSAGLLLAGFGIATGVAMLAAGMAKARSERPLLMVGATMMGLGLLAVATTSSLPVVAGALLPVAIGFGIVTTLGFPAYSAFIPAGEEGAYSAMYFSVRSVASALAVPGAGWTIAVTDSYRALFVAGGAVTLAALVPLLALRPRRADVPRPRMRMLRIGVVLVGMTGAVLGAGLLMQETALFEADAELFGLVYGLDISPHTVDVLLVDPHIQNYVALTLLCGLLARIWRPGQALRAAATVAAAGIVAYVMVRISWTLWERPRPEELLGIPPANGHKWADYPSFPSGHVAVTTAIVLAGALLLPRLKVAFWAYAAVVAVTRITYGAHLPSDVFAGLVLGWLAAVAAVGVATGRPLVDRHRLHALFVEEAGTPLMRTIARVGSTLALALFALAVVATGLPVSPDGAALGASVERSLQIGLLVLVALGVVGGWWHSPLGGLLLLGGLGLGSLAALQYSPLTAVLAYLALAAPATASFLAWPRARTRHGVTVVATLVAVTTAVGAALALAIHDRAYGPAHPESAQRPPETWRVKWIWSGGVSAQTAVVTARINTDSDVRLRWGTSPSLRGARASAAQHADDEPNDGLVTFRLDGLRPRTRYFYGVEVDGRLDRNRIGRLRTFAQGRQSFTIAFAGCARVGSNGAVFDAIRRERPALFLALGDFFYANIDQNARKRFVDQYDRSVGSPAQGALYRSTPVTYTWDDHDFGGNGSDAGARSRPAARWAYRTAVPHYPLPAGDGGAIYHAFSVGRVRFLVMDTRSERRPGHTMLGAEQLRWLRRELLASRDRDALTVLVSSVPWIAGPGESSDTWAGFARERAALSRFIARNRIDRVMLLAGDAHMLAIDDGSNSDYSGTGRAGFPVMQAAALDRPGSKRGGPFSEGMFPGAGQYGTMTVRDRGRRVDVALRGRDWRGRLIVRHAFGVTPPASAR